MLIKHTIIIKNTIIFFIINTAFGPLKQQKLIFVIRTIYYNNESIANRHSLFIIHLYYSIIILKIHINNFNSDNGRMGINCNKYSNKQKE